MFLMLQETPTHLPPLSLFENIALARWNKYIRWNLCSWQLVENIERFSLRKIPFFKNSGKNQINFNPNPSACNFSSGQTVCLHKHTLKPRTGKSSPRNPNNCSSPSSQQHRALMFPSGLLALQQLFSCGCMVSSRRCVTSLLPWRLYD